MQKNIDQEKEESPKVYFSFVSEDRSVTKPFKVIPKYYHSSSSKKKEQEKRLSDDLETNKNHPVAVGAVPQEDNNHSNRRNLLQSVEVEDPSSQQLRFNVEDFNAKHITLREIERQLGGQDRKPEGQDRKPEGKDRKPAAKMQQPAILSDREFGEDPYFATYAETVKQERLKQQPKKQVAKSCLKPMQENVQQRKLAKNECVPKQVGVRHKTTASTYSGISASSATDRSNKLFPPRSANPPARLLPPPLNAKGINAKKPEYQCVFCDRKFALLNTLNVHMLHHCMKIPTLERRKINPNKIYQRVPTSMLDTNSKQTRAGLHKSSKK